MADPTRTERDAAFGKRFMGLFCVFGILCFVSVVVLVETMPFLGAPLGLMFLLGPVVIVVFAILFHFLVVRRYRCPSCHARLAVPPRKRGCRWELNYDCPDCQVLWQTGIRESD
jgi:hypothetical protein